MHLKCSLVKSLFFLFLTGLINLSAFCQSLAVNSTGAIANASAILDVSSANKGLLVPRMTAAQRLAIAVPANGLLVYDNDSLSFAYFNGTAWNFLKGTINTYGTWGLKGNNGTVDGTNFIGTTDNVPLSFRINNNAAGRIDPNKQNVFLGSFSGGSILADGNTAIGHFVLKNNSSGSGNTAIGDESMLTNTIGSANVAIGMNALASNVNGSFNIAIGTGTLGEVSSGSSNTAVGHRSMNNNTGNDNTAIGINALSQNTESGNVAIGNQTLTTNTSGKENTAIGYQSLQFNNTAKNNTAIGYFALKNNNADNNTAIGNRSMQNNAGGNYNTALGTSSLNFSTNSSYNVVMGNDALGAGFGNENVSIGYKAAYNSQGNKNLAIGLEALYNNTTNENMAIGFKALRENISGTHNTGVGFQALQNNQSNNNTALGYNTLQQTSFNANNNTAIGNEALKILFNGSNNVAIGNRANNSANNSNDNIAIGSLAMFAYTGDNNIAIGSSVLSTGSGTSNVGIGKEVLKDNTGSYNTGTGANCLFRNIAGEHNTANGYQSLNKNINGNDNSSIGYNALYNNLASYNTAVGANALYNNSTGTKNTGSGYEVLFFNQGMANSAFGYHALYNNQTGNHNTAIGENTLNRINYGDYNTSIGYNADVLDGLTNATAIGAYALAQQSNTLILGSTIGINGALVSTNVGIGTPTPNAPLQFGNFIANRKIVLLDGPNNDHQFEGFGTDGNGLRYQVESSINDHTFYAGVNSSTSNELMRITGTGKIGIGNPAPSAKLDVNGAMLAEGAQATHAQGVWLEWNKDGGSGKSYMLNQKGLGSGGFVFGEVNNANAITERLVIDNNGNVGIGGVAPTQKLHVAGNGLFTGTVTASCGVLTCSDIRYKKEIQPLKNSLSKIIQLNGVSYYFKKEYFKDKNFNDNKQVGLIAQDVEKIYPELVQTDAEGFKSIDYAKLTPILVEAIKELQTQNDLLKNDNLLLKASMAAIETKLEKIEKILNTGTNQ